MQTTASAARRVPSAVATPATAPSPRRSTSVTSTPRCTGTPASVSAVAIARGTACIPPSGWKTPRTVSMYVMTAKTARAAAGATPA